MAGFESLQITERSEEFQMEVEALQAIFESEFSCRIHDGDTLFEVSLADNAMSLMFVVSDKYPDETPGITVLKDNAEWADKLEAHLNQKAKENLGTAMIFVLVEEAKEWANKHQVLALSSDSVTGDTTTPVETKQSNICNYFLEGKCKFGDKCFNRHVMVTSQGLNQDLASRHANISGSSPITSSCSGNSSMLNVLPSKTNVEVAAREDSSNQKNTITGKKKPMKTATDVISRIQWDEQLSEKDFVIGYLDRFIGIIEQDFSAFSWEDIASVDYNTLSIPRHRIQYFKFKGEIVWDKRERLDRVFGSTGSGETILEIVESHKQKAMQKQEVPDDSAKEELEGDQDQETNLDVGDSVVHSRKCKGRETEGPSFFIALPITNPKVTNEIQELQEELATADSNLGEGAVPTQRLHLTLLTLNLANEEQERVGKHVMKGLQPLLSCVLPPTHPLVIRGVGTFRDRLLYVGVEQDPLLSQLVNILKFKFSQAGLALEGNRDVFAPHITVLRAHQGIVSPARARQLFSDVESKYGDYTFGDQKVHAISLCSKFAPKDPDGSHQSIFTARNSILTLSSSLASKLSARLETLDREGQLKSETKYQITKKLKSGDAVDAEEALAALEALPPEENRVVLIVRGIPGCGKTHLIENSTESQQGTGIAVITNTQLFQRAGNTSVEQTELSISETYGRIRYLESLASGIPLVVVDDVHSQRWEYTLQLRLARGFGYECRVLEISCVDSAAIKLCHKHCRSGTSIEQLTLMVETWESDPDAALTPPWFSKPKHQQGQPVTLKQFTK